MEQVERFVARWLTGPLFLGGGVWIVSEWMGGAVWRFLGIPVTPLLALVAFGMGAWFFKLGYVDGDADAIVRFWRRG